MFLPITFIIIGTSTAYWLFCRQLLLFGDVSSYHVCRGNLSFILWSLATLHVHERDSLQSLIADTYVGSSAGADRRLAALAATGK